MFTRYFWQATAERAIKSFAQCLAALLGVGGMGLLDANWPTVLSTAGMAALLSVLTSLASERVGRSNDPSLLPAPGDAVQASSGPSATQVQPVS